MRRSNSLQNRGNNTSPSRVSSPGNSSIDSSPVTRNPPSPSRPSSTRAPVVQPLRTRPSTASIRTSNPSPTTSRRYQATGCGSSETDFSGLTSGVPSHHATESQSFQRAFGSERTNTPPGTQMDPNGSMDDSVAAVYAQQLQQATLLLSQANQQNQALQQQIANNARIKKRLKANVYDKTHRKSTTAKRRNNKRRRQKDRSELKRFKASQLAQGQSSRL